MEETKIGKEKQSEITRLKKRIVSLESAVVELKLTTESLQKNETNLLSLLRSLGDLVFLIGMDGSFARYYQDPNRDDLFLPPKQFLGKSVREVFPPDLAELFQKAINAVESYGQPQAFDFFIAMKNRELWFNARISLYRPTSGDFFGYLCEMHNITERKQVEEVLRESEERFRAVMQQSILCIFLADIDTRVILEANQSMQRLLGYSREEISGLSLYDFMEKEKEDIYRKILQILKDRSYYIGERRFRRKDGTAVEVEISVNLISYRGKEVMCVVARDVSPRRLAERQLIHTATHDPLTNLVNRLLLYDRLAQELARARRHNRKIALINIDLDRFKRVNDTLGHFTGDQLLQEVTKRLLGCVRENDTVARLGGDEFTIILTNLSSSGVAADIALEIINSIRKAIYIQGHELFVGASIGISLYPDDSDKKDILIRYADAAMYHAKDKGRGNFQFFSEKINQRNQKRSKLESSLRRAIKNEEFELYYQPQIDIFSQQIIGSEALIRWNDPENGQISPLDFIPIAEENGLILEIGRWAFQRTCKHLRHCIDSGIKVIRVAVNLSAVQFRDDGLIEMITTALEQENISHEWIELEITESAIMENADNAVSILEKLSAIGIRISIDDFGTGYSSLAYLKKFPIDKLKIDREFIKDLPDNNDDIVLTTTMINLATSMGIDVLAEGAETQEQIDFLRNKKCQYVQGYYYSKPLPEKEFIKFISLAEENKLCS